MKVNGRMIGEPLVKYYHGNDKLGTLNTINARYMSKQLSPSQRMYNKLLDAHYDGICKFLKPPNQRAKLIFDQEKVYEGVRDTLSNCKTNSGAASVQKRPNIFARSN